MRRPWRLPQPTRDFPVEPPTNPETAIVSTQSLQILADATNGTIYYDVDAKAACVVIKNFSTVAMSLPNKFVRVCSPLSIERRSGRRARLDQQHI